MLLDHDTLFIARWKAEELRRFAVLDLLPNSLSTESLGSMELETDKTQPCGLLPALPWSCRTGPCRVGPDRQTQLAWFVRPRTSSKHVQVSQGRARPEGTEHVPIAGRLGAGARMHVRHYRWSKATTGVVCPHIGPFCPGCPDCLHF